MNPKELCRVGSGGVYCDHRSLGPIFVTQELSSSDK